MDRNPTETSPSKEKEIKNYVDKELARLKKERRAAVRKKRNKTRKILTAIWKHVDWSRK